MLYAPQPNVYRCGMGDLTPSECAVRCAKAIEELIKFHQPKYGRGADRGTGDERRGGAWPRLLADAPRDMQRVRCRADRRRGDDGSGQDGQDVRGRPLGRRAGYHDDGRCGLSGGYMPIGAVDGHHCDCRPLRGHGLLLPARLHVRGASGRGRRCAQEHRDHRVGATGGKRRRVRRVPLGVALDSHGATIPSSATFEGWDCSAPSSW